MAETACPAKWDDLDGWMVEAMVYYGPFLIHESCNCSFLMKGLDNAVSNRSCLLCGRVEVMTNSARHCSSEQLKLWVVGLRDGLICTFSWPTWHSVRSSSL